LGRDHLKSIVEIQARALLNRLEDRKIHVELTEAAKDQLVAEGHDPMYGARPLKRTIQRRVLDALAMRVLAGEFTEGDRVTIDAEGGTITFKKAGLAQPA
jgi:ATP-dependent Clp protease ATP-binding subunit ClpB